MFFNHFKQCFIKNLAIINFCISLITLTYQITILNPWHTIISNQIILLNKEITLLNIKIDEKKNIINDLTQQNNLIIKKNN
jgi:hypothetical protein